MTELLIRCFIKNRENTTDPKVRTAYGNLAGIVGILCNLLLFAGKYLIGFFAGSISIMADAINNLSDASSNIVSLLGFKLGAMKADPEHPYGHGRYEYLAGLMVCAIILGIGFSLAKDSVLKILHPEEVVFHWLTLVILVGSILVKFWMFVFNKKIGTRIKSDTLLAAAADSRNDVLSTAAVMAAAVICKVTGFYRIDGIFGLAVAVFIIVSGWGLLQETLSPILGKAPDKELVKHIEAVIMGYPGVLGIHDLMVHDYGPGKMFATVHVEFSVDQDVLEVHELLDDIESEFLQKDGLLLTIHYDPVVTDNEEQAAVARYLAESIREFDPRLNIHEVRLVPGNRRVNVVFDCVKPAGYEKKDGEIRQYLVECLAAYDPKYRCVVKIEQSYV